MKMEKTPRYTQRERNMVLGYAAQYKDIIENEDKKQPLSDNEICAILCEKGYKIARRTVAKYRESQPPKLRMQ